MDSVFQNLIWAVVGGIIGSIIALKMEKYQEPQLDIVASESANDDVQYTAPPFPPNHAHLNERWKFFRVKVINKSIPHCLSWFLERETAQQVNATITFRQLDKTMKGRWASTLELVNASPLDYNRIINFPDPVTIFSGKSEILDVFAKHYGDDEAYGWNNEAYPNNWRTLTYKLVPGDYLIDIHVVAINGSQTRKAFKAHIARQVSKTNLRNKR